MISHKYKCIFIHIPKTGGTSIENALLGGKKQPTRIKHKRAKDYLKQYPKEWKQYFKFTVIRNPWDWMVSWYYWRGQNSKTSIKEFLTNYRLVHKKNSNYLPKKIDAVAIQLLTII